MKLGRDRQGRTRLLRNLAISFVRHDHVQTTEARATALQVLIQKLSRIARKGTLANARSIHDVLQHPLVTEKLMQKVAEFGQSTPLTRLVKSSIRRGDGARLATLGWIHPLQKTENISPKTTAS